MNSMQQEIHERANLTAFNKFELLIFRLGQAKNCSHSELFGINVFKVREIVAMPTVTEIAGADEHIMGVVNLRGQIIPVINLPSLVGCAPTKDLAILLVTEYARSVQGFAVESVEEIVRLDWGQVLSAEASSVAGMVTSIARLDGDAADTRLAQVLDVEKILRSIQVNEDEESTNLPRITCQLPVGSLVLAADDSNMARTLIEKSLTGMGAPYIMTKTGKECWERLQALAEEARVQGKSIHEKVAVILTDLEMPEMDGFTLTRKIKQDPRFQSIPVVIHSSLTGSSNEGHIKNAGADAYVAKFVEEELRASIVKVLSESKELTVQIA